MELVGRIRWSADYRANRLKRNSFPMGCFVGSRGYRRVSHAKKCKRRVPSAIAALWAEFQRAMNGLAAAAGFHKSTLLPYTVRHPARPKKTPMPIGHACSACARRGREKCSYFADEAVEHFEHRIDVCLTKRISRPGNCLIAICTRGKGKITALLGINGRGTFDHPLGKITVVCDGFRSLVWFQVPASCFLFSFLRREQQIGEDLSQPDAGEIRTQPLMRIR